MSEQEKSIVEQYCKKMDDRYLSLMKVIYGLIIVILGAGAIQFVSFGATKNQVESLQKSVDFVSKDYIPTMFLEGLLKNQNYQTQEIVSTINGDKQRVKEINEKYIDFQKTMLNNFIQQRGGYTNITRGGKK
jgi:hypothetical protein